jgi:hypothetical protein
MLKKEGEESKSPELELLFGGRDDVDETELE